MRRAAFAGLVAMILAVAGCGGESGGDSKPATVAKNEKPTAGGTLRIAVPADPITLDPNVGETDPASSNAHALIFDRLVNGKAGSPTEVEPGLATAWKLAADKKSMTFALRDAKFSDGTAVTSEDVKFSFDRAMDVKTDPRFAASLRELIASVSTPDPKTVVLHFDGPAPAVVPYATISVLAVISKAAFERLGAKQFATQPVGSGPFQVKKWIKGQRLELTKNPHYWQHGRPYVDGADLVTVPDNNTRLLQVRSGQVDVADGLAFAQIDAVRESSQLRLQRLDSALVYFALFNSGGPLKSPLVRQALNYATPKEAIKKIVFKDQAEVAGSFIPKLKYSEGNAEPVPFDVEKAKQLLAEAGVKTPITIEVVFPGSDAPGRQTVSILQDAWGKIGVKAKLVPLGLPEVVARTNTGNYQVLLFAAGSGGSDVPSEDEYAINFTSPAFEQLLNLSDPKLRDIVKRIEGTWDENERRRLFGEFFRQQQVNPPGVQLVWLSPLAALRPNVRNYAYTFVNIDLTDTWIKR